MFCYISIANKQRKRNCKVVRIFPVCFLVFLFLFASWKLTLFFHWVFLFHQFFSCIRKFSFTFLCDYARKNFIDKTMKSFYIVILLLSLCLCFSYFLCVCSLYSLQLSSSKSNQKKRKEKKVLLNGNVIKLLPEPLHSNETGVKR